MSYLNWGLMSSVGQTQNTDIMWKCRGNAVGLSCIKQPYPCAGNLSHALDHGSRQKEAVCLCTVRQDKRNKRHCAVVKALVSAKVTEILSTTPENYSEDPDGYRQ